MFHSVLEIFHFIPASSIFHTKLFVSFHSIPCPGCRFNIIIIVTLYPNGCSQFQNPEAPDFEKIASAFSSFSTLSLPSLLSLPISFSKMLLLPLPQKLTAFTTSSFLFRFHIPDLNIPKYASLLTMLYSGNI